MGAGGRKVAVILLVWCVCGFGSGGDGGNPAAEEADLSSVSLNWLPENPKQGEVVRLSLQGPEEMRVRGAEAQSRALAFYPALERPGHWESLYGIDAEQEPGEVEITVFLDLPGPREPGVVRGRVGIGKRVFAEERLTLPDRMVHLGARDLERVRKEEEVISALWLVHTPERVWNGPFAMPLQGRRGSPFGLRRWINGEPRSFHTGMDVKAAEGAPVRAAHAGRVVLTGDFFFGGKSVFLDHGQGLYTMYFHLSGVRVKPAESVGQGEVVGWVGQTGRASGPHLHWGARLAGARVDPLSLIESTQDPLPVAEAR